MTERLLLDTHTVIFWFYQPSSLSEAARLGIAARANTIYFSPVSAMEIATKVRKGGLAHARALANDFVRPLLDSGFVELPIKSEHATLAGSLALPNQDPWDRLLIAQALSEQMRLVSRDSQFGDYASLTLW